VKRPPPAQNSRTHVDVFWVVAPCSVVVVYQHGKILRNIPEDVDVNLHHREISSRQQSPVFDRSKTSVLVFNCRCFNHRNNKNVKMFIDFAFRDS